MLKGIFFKSVLLKSSFFLFFFYCNISLDFQKFFICFFETFSCILSFFSSFKFFKFLSLKFILYLFFNQLSFQLFLFHFLDVAEFEVIKLLGDARWIFHFLEILFLQLFTKSFIILSHLLLLQLFPLKFNFFCQLFFLFSCLDLDILLSNNIAH